MSRRPKLAVWKFASCDGCQLTLLNREDDLLALADEIQIAYFPEATRGRVRGPYDVSLVEGSVTTRADVERIHRVRQASRFVVAIGACATSGGIQALRNFADVDEFRSVVYAHPAYVEALDRSHPISDHVHVDFELRGCPIDGDQLMEVLAALLQHRAPRIGDFSVCYECKRAGAICVAVCGQAPCLGPVTHAGCGALCPRYGRACYGCFGPSASPNTTSLVERLRVNGMAERDLTRVFRTFNAAAEPFATESARHDT